MAKRHDQPPARAHPDRFSASVTLHNDRAQIDDIVRRVTEATTAFGYSSTSSFAVRLALEEAISNAFRHGHLGLDPGVPIFVTCSVTPSQVELTVRDRGPGFRPGDVPDPTLDENLERTSGRGLMLMKAYMSKVEYNSRGNEVRMVYDNPADRPAQAC